MPSIINEPLHTSDRTHATIPHILYTGQETTHKYNELYFFIQHVIDYNNTIPGSTLTSENTVLQHYPNANNCDVFYMNCAHTSSVSHIHIVQDTMQAYIRIQTSRFRFVLIDQAMYLSNDAQAILRQYIERCSHNIRFIFVADSRLHSNLIVPIISRLTTIHISSISCLNTQPLVLGPISTDENVNTIRDTDNYSLIDTYMYADQLYQLGFCAHYLFTNSKACNSKSHQQILQTITPEIIKANTANFNNERMFIMYLLTLQNSSKINSSK